MPSLEIMRAVTDSNIQGDGAENRRESFTLSTDLISQGDVDVLIEGILFEKVEHRLLEDQKVFFNSVYRIDNSARGVIDYDIVKAIKWVAESESKIRRVIILSENFTNYDDCMTDRIACVNSQTFIMNVRRASALHTNGTFSTLEDALIAIFFTL